MGNGRVIAVSGPPGCGKTVIATRIAAALADAGKKTVLFYLDNTVPSLPVIFPHRKRGDLKSIGEVLMSIDVDADALLKSAMTTESSPNLICLGYMPGENVRTYPPFSPARAARLYEAALTVADCVIADVKSDFTSDVLSETALSRADVLLSVYNPDIKTLSYYSSAAGLYAGTEGKTVLNVLNNCRGDVFFAEDEMKETMKKVDASIPYSGEIAACMTEGSLLIHGGSAKFNSSVKKIAGMLLTEETADER